MSVWYIFVALLGPMVALMVWMIIAQHRGRFRAPKPKRTEPDFFQRHAMLVGIVAVLAYGLLMGGVLGLAVSGAVLLTLALLAALIVTTVESIKPRRMGPTAGAGPCEATAPFSRRFIRNFRRAITDLPLSWG